MNLDNIGHITMLYEFYGKLLTEKQQQIITQYIFNNLSFAEIADITNTSRQAAKDLFDRTLNILEEFESKLKCIQKYQKSSNLLKNSIKDSNIINNFIKIWEE